MGDKVLIHHGIPDQRWGVRRYQNYDGTLTPAGRERYGYTSSADTRYLAKASKKLEEDYKNDLKTAKARYKDDLASIKDYMDTKRYGDARRKYEMQELKRDAKLNYQNEVMGIQEDYKFAKADIAEAIGSKNTGKKVLAGYLLGSGLTIAGKLVKDLPIGGDQKRNAQIGKALKGAGIATISLSTLLGGKALAAESKALR